ncbi:thioredoxin chloroplastic [Raphidocelis subcapitata]|uniref:Thioredoxin chloroplastic n=1 Tax=Raphidocelis subcapitata TaxID=307507 RepID=A0A2V0PF80_9CHLO|nr:thioredoxin chloroplastic [Raphidocelis subcapitata]|eukprot:GBF98486.1 thioredoxin chloroplastic [Raphidocelis subcapitata]
MQLSSASSRLGGRFNGSSTRRPRLLAAAPPRALRDETPEQQLERRLRESARVDERVIDIFSAEDFQRELAAAGNKLVVLEAQSEEVCMTGLDEEPELQWKADKDAALQPCVAIKHTFQRTARECPDVLFMSLHADADEAQELCDELGIEVIPTLQFWRNGAKLWEHKGVMNMDQDLGEGVLFFNGSAGGGVQAGDHVAELKTPAEMRAFVESQSDSVLTVVDVSTSDAAPCIRVFPAVLALARSFKGYAAFGRVLADASEEGAALLREYNVMEVPTFLFFKNGREVDRHVGSSRGDLIGKILEVQARFGVAPPPPPPGAGGQRRVIQRRVTRRTRASP